MGIPEWIYGKTALAAYGFVGLAVWHLSQGQYEQAVTAILAALGTLGLRHAQAKISESIGPPPLKYEHVPDGPTGPP